MDTNFGIWFRKLREKRGQTQRETAIDLCISGTTICRWEKGAEPRAGHLLRVQRWAQVPPEKLLRLVAAA